MMQPRTLKGLHSTFPSDGSLSILSQREFFRVERVP
jgi:hypothetical protein